MATPEYCTDADEHARTHARAHRLTFCTFDLADPVVEAA